MTDVFGNVHLGYLVVQTQRLTDWRRFGADAVGLHVDELTPDTTRFRLDDRECRFLLQRGTAEDVTALGWQVDDHETFDVILERVTSRGLPVREGTPDECALRGVERLWRFPGPKGAATEIFTTPLTTPSPLVMRNSAFVTGESGMGHVAITSKDVLGLHSYYSTLFDARLSDFILERIGPMDLRIRFLRVNERHHSVAVAGVRRLAVDPIRTVIQHVNVQVAELDDMVAAHERVTAEGFKMMWSVGQHPNDRSISFYCQTPSGFELEVGWSPLVVTEELESTWEPTTYQGISLWGHTPVGEDIIHKMGMVRQALRSARYAEGTVPELRDPASVPA
ncbi:MAG: VOC family protein [Nocardioides sp.]|nr:VOC family protein [Nocardioidaceae bacterium]MCB8956215.1 VOC family protein [Nocardioides sp.]